MQLPAAGQYAVGQIFSPQNARQREQCHRILENVAAQLGHEVRGAAEPLSGEPLGACVPCRVIWIGSAADPLLPYMQTLAWRAVPTDNTDLGKSALNTFRQLKASQIEFENEAMNFEK